MRKLVECVPNFSEGRNQDTIDAIANAIRSVQGVKLLDVDPGKSTNRTVYTFVGEPNSIVLAAFEATKIAKELIDMATHTGEHPRMGALDVCPFVPVANVTMQECIECSNKYAELASTKLGIPIYLYEESQSQEYRKKLSDIRHGEYEAVSTRIKEPKWKPDYGAAEFVPNWGATATGARNFLIAYNVNILATNNQAHRIALNLREAGRGEEEPGLLKEVKAIGWWMEEYNMAQVSMNLNNFKTTAFHTAYESVKEQADKLNVAVAGSELVGLIPLEAMLMAAEHYIKKENLFIVDQKQKIRLVIERLGLNSITHFDPDKRIIEYLIAEEHSEPLASKTLREFIESVAARTSAPGGGSVAATIASLGAGLANMVAWLTYGVRKFEDVQPKMQEAIPNLSSTVQKLIPFVDADTNAFNDYLTAVRMPKDNKEQQDSRHSAMQNGLKKAVEVPLNLMKTANSIWIEMEITAQYGNIASVSDIEIGVKALELGIWGAYRNVLINLSQIEDDKFNKKVTKEAELISKEAAEKAKHILEILNKRK